MSEQVFSDSEREKAWEMARELKATSPESRSAPESREKSEIEAAYECLRTIATTTWVTPESVKTHARQFLESLPTSAVHERLKAAERVIEAARSLARGGDKSFGTRLFDLERALDAWDARSASSVPEEQP